MSAEIETVAPLVGIKVSDTPGQLEVYEIGKRGCTDVRWVFFPGPHCNLPGVEVWIEGERHSFHPAGNLKAIYYRPRAQ